LKRFCGKNASGLIPLPKIFLYTWAHFGIYPNGFQEEVSMTVSVAINGFGRIGRLVLRALAEAKRTDVKVVAINDLGDAETNAHMIKYDSAHGTFPGEVKVEGDTLTLTNGSWTSGPIKMLAQPKPELLPWKDLNVDICMECTGRFTKRDEAAVHLQAGAKKVLVSAPADGADLTVVMGVNQDQLKPEHKVVSNASCTTNCLAPVAYVLNKAFGIEQGYMSTIHSYTGDQRLVDTIHKDKRRARAAAQNIIPSTTGAAKAIGLVIPELKGKLDGTAIRVPTQNVSLVDFKFIAKTPVTVEAVNKAIVEAASNGPLKGILGATKEELVSGDFNHNPNSSTFDLTQTQVIDGKLVRILSWYDNEWGFSNRMLDTAVAMKAVGCDSCSKAA
jgi:glyceraldehyde 3-phosphate dehydrogenase